MMRWRHCGMVNFVTYSNMNKNVYIIMFHLCSLNWSVDARTLAEQHEPPRNGDWIVPKCKKSFGQSAFSVKGANLELPAYGDKTRIGW